MATEIKGHCACGAVTYTFHSKTPELDTVVCHCDTCQRLGGGPYGLLVGTTKDDLKINGPIKKFTTTSTSGKNTHKYFCETCGSSIAREHESMAPNVSVLAGTVDKEFKSKLQAPKVEVWNAAKLSFINLNAATSLPGNPPLN